MFFWRIEDTIVCFRDCLTFSLRYVTVGTSTFYYFTSFSNSVTKMAFPQEGISKILFVVNVHKLKQILSCIPICASKGWLHFSCMRIEKFHHCLLAQNGSLQGQFILKCVPIISNIPCSRADLAEVLAEVIGKSNPIQNYKYLLHNYLDIL